MNNTGMILDAYSLSDVMDLAVRAEKAGFHSVWVTELYRSAFGQLSAVASVTEKILLGTAVSLAFTRSPLVTSLTLMDIDELSGGRAVLGLGTGAKRTNEKFHNSVFGKPVKHISECTELVRLYVSSLHKDSNIIYSGEYYNVDMKGFKRPFPPIRDDVPIFLAGIGKNMIRTAAVNGDGYIGHVVCSKDYIRNVVLPQINSGLEENLNRERFCISSIITCAVSDNIQKARRAARATIAFYALVRTYEPPFRMHGFLDQTQKIRDAYFRKDVEGMISNVPDDMLDTFAVVGDSEYCKQKINEYREYINLPILSVPHYFIDYKEVREYQNNLLEVFGNTCR